MKEMFPGPGPAGTVGLSHEVCCVIELSGQVWQVSAAAAAAAADWGGCVLRIERRVGAFVSPGVRWQCLYHVALVVTQVNIARLASACKGYEPHTKLPCM